MELQSKKHPKKPSHQNRVFFPFEPPKKASTLFFSFLATATPSTPHTRVIVTHTHVVIASSPSLLFRHRAIIAPRGASQCARSKGSFSFWPAAVEGTLLPG